MSYDKWDKPIDSSHLPLTPELFERMVEELKREGGEPIPEQIYYNCPYCKAFIKGSNPCEHLEKATKDYLDQLRKEGIL